MNISQKLVLLSLALMLFSNAAISAEATPNIEFGGRIQADDTNFDNDKFQYTDGSELRRGRLFVRGDLTENWDYKLQYDFAPDHTEVKDAFVRYSGFENTLISIGNYKQFSSLEELTSSNNTTFAERALPNALVSAGRRLGIGYQTWSDRYSIAASVYENEPNNLVRGKGIAGRFVYRPNLGEEKILHLGLALSREEDEDDIILRRARPESHQSHHRIIDTNLISGVKSFDKIGLEAAYVDGRFSAQAEFVTQNLERSPGSDLTFDGYYAYVSYFLTDDTRPYSNSNGYFGTVTPSSPKGAWEIAARISSLDLTDKEIAGGEVDIFTLGVNYYMTRDLRFTANYIMADSDSVAGDDDPNALQLRIRFTF